MMKVKHNNKRRFFTWIKEFILDLLIFIIFMLTILVLICSDDPYGYSVACEFLNNCKSYLSYLFK